MEKLPLFRAAQYDAVPWEELRIFCHVKARYVLPTLELIDWLKERIGNRKALEIGAGYGDLGYHLKIPMVDNWQQQLNPVVVAQYKAMQQPCIQYQQDVHCIDAIAGIELYKPEVVVGGWITHTQINEKKVIRMVDEYILIGSSTIHCMKPIMKYPHETIDAPFVRSRRKDNTIWVWKRLV
jgi:hypothetical protein